MCLDGATGALVKKRHLLSIFLCTRPAAAAGATDTLVASGGFNFGPQGQCSTQWSLGLGLDWERLWTQAQNH